MPKQKRMVYIYEENLAYYDGLENKSEFINGALTKAKVELPHADPNGVDYVKRKLAIIDEQRQREVLRRNAQREAQQNS